MPRVPLTGGAYQARSPVSAAQRQLNLYSEPMPQHQGEPAPSALYPTAGLSSPLCTLPDAPVRALKLSTLGVLYAVAGRTVFRIADDWAYTALGTISPGTTPVSMDDNGTDLVIVDGSDQGWQVTLATGAFAAIRDATGSFVGANRVDYLDTYLLFDKPDTPQFYASESAALTFDPLWFANKEAYSDLLVTLVVAKSEIYLLGTQTTEIWFDAGAADFPFQRQQGVLIDHGCAAVYSAVEIDNGVYFLGRDRQGQGIILRCAGYQATRISTYAIETEIASYDVISDAIGLSYQYNGHVFYHLTFPSADKTWLYDVTTELWSELAWSDGEGNEHRHRANCAAAAYGKVVVGDWQSGSLYQLDPSVYTDAAAPILRLRAFPHIEGNDGQRMVFRKFQANVSVGNAAVTTAADDLKIFLTWSDSRGVSWGNPVGASLGATGEYLTSVQWQRLGMARSRVFRVHWTGPFETALLGAWVDVSPALS
jgi:hypothetical protein